MINRCNNCIHELDIFNVEPCKSCIYNNCYNDNVKFNFVSKYEKEEVSYIIKLATEIAELVEKKNNDYGNSFDSTINDYGNIVYFVRISDKLNRLKMLLLQGNEIEVKDEKIEDTLKDIIGYTLLMLNYIKNNQ